MPTVFLFPIILPPCHHAALPQQKNIHLHSLAPSSWPACLHNTFAFTGLTPQRQNANLPTNQCAKPFAGSFFTGYKQRDNCQTNLQTAAVDSNPQKANLASSQAPAYSAEPTRNSISPDSLQLAVRMNDAKTSDVASPRFMQLLPAFILWPSPNASAHRLVTDIHSSHN